MTTAGIPGDKKVSLLSVQQVAEICDCSKRTVIRLVRAGKMPGPVKLGTLTRWPRHHIEQWIDGGCKPIRRSATA